MSDPLNSRARIEARDKLIEVLEAENSTLREQLVSITERAAKIAEDLDWTVADPRTIRNTIAKRIRALTDEKSA